MPTSITPFTTTPSRANPATFSADMDTRLTQENSRITEMNLQSGENNVINTNVNAKEATAVAAASTATTKAGEALSSANAASLSAAAALVSETAAAALLDAFDDRYLGAKSVEPTLDNDGNALLSGALYYNTVTDMMKVYDLALTTWMSLSFIPTDHGSLTGLADDDHPQYAKAIPIYTPISIATTLVKNTKYAVTFGTVLTLTLPLTPANNDFVEILVSSGTSVGSTIARNGSTIMGLAEDLSIDTAITSLKLIYNGTTWRIA